MEEYYLSQEQYNQLMQQLGPGYSSSEKQNVEMIRGMPTDRLTISNGGSVVATGGYAGRVGGRQARGSERGVLLVLDEADPASQEVRAALGRLGIANRATEPDAQATVELSAGQYAQLRDRLSGFETPEIPRRRPADPDEREGRIRADGVDVGSVQARYNEFGALQSVSVTSQYGVVMHAMGQVTRRDQQMTGSGDIMDAGMQQIQDSGGRGTMRRRM